MLVYNILLSNSTGNYNLKIHKSKKITKKYKELILIMVDIIDSSIASLISSK